MNSNYSNSADLGATYVYVVGIIMFGFLLVAVCKEISFFALEDHAFGHGSFAVAVENTPIENLFKFPTKLIYWRRSFIVSFLIALLSVIIYSMCFDLKASWARLLGVFVLMHLSAFTLLYHKDNFYNFHVYKLLAEAWEKRMMGERSAVPPTSLAPRIDW